MMALRRLARPGQNNLGWAGLTGGKRLLPVASSSARSGDTVMVDSELAKSAL